MSELDKALDRLGDAITMLVGTVGRGQDPGGDDAAARIAELTAEIAELRAQREDDARLRSEATEAVRDALSDLRGMLATKGDDNG